MIIRHHPNDETLLACAAGALDPALALVVQSHLAKCPACRGRHGLAVALGGALLHEPGDPPALERTMESMLSAVHRRIKSAAPEPDSRLGTVAEPDGLSALREVLYGSHDGIAWQPLLPGVDYVSIVDNSAGDGPERGARARLLRLQPGVTLPRHTHTGEEYALVLHGSFIDQTGRYSVGDFAEADGSLEHEPSVDSADPCIALLAIEGEIRFSHPVHRWALRSLRF